MVDSNEASTSAISTSHPASRKASAVRRPERSETSRSCDSPPANIRTRGKSCDTRNSLWWKMVLRHELLRQRLRLKHVRRRGLNSGARGFMARLRPEDINKFHLALNHVAKATNTFRDALFRRVAERQAHVPPAVIVGVETCAGNISNTLRNCTREHCLGIKPFWQRDPHVEATFRYIPRQLRKMLVQCRNHGVTTALIHLLE